MRVTSEGRRVLVIGLDSATFDLIEPWAADGALPNLARLMAQGSRGRLASTLQPTTAPAWVTFMTGVNQGKHGLYDFVRRQPGSYNLEVTNASHINAPTVFETVSQAERRVISINVPYTFPPRIVNGVMIGGPFAPVVTAELVYPKSYFHELKKVAPDYFIIPDYDPHATDPLEAFAQRLLQGVELRERLALHLMRTEAWDLFSVVFMEIDEVQHSFWKCMDAPAGSTLAPYRHVIRQVYQRVDQALGALLAQVSGEVLVIVLSDHGAGPLRWIIQLNQWLADHGYFEFLNDDADRFGRLRSKGFNRLAHAYRRYVPSGIRRRIRNQIGGQHFERLKGEFESAQMASHVAWERTRAYALGSGGNISINLRGREPAGIVEPGAEYERLRSEIIDGLLKLIDPQTKRAVVKRVYRREELYHGPFLDQAADLIIEWDDYACWGRGVYSGPTLVFETLEHFDFSDQPLSGAHRPDGILIMQGEGVKPGAQVEGAHLLDLAPTILAAMGLGVPDTFDGRILQEAFVAGTFENHAALTLPAVASAAYEAMSYTAEDEAKIFQHLKDLGYF